MPALPFKPSGQVLLEQIKKGRTELGLHAAATEDLVRTLKNIMYDLGLPPSMVPGEEQFVRLVTHLRTHCARFSCLDLETAFKLYITGQLDYTEKFYGTFSPMFVELVMQSFGRYRFPIVKASEPPEEVVKEKSPEQKYIDSRAYCLARFDEFKTDYTSKKAVLFMDEGNVIYKTLTAYKIHSLSSDEIKRIRGLAKKKLMDETPGHILKNILADANTALERENVIAREIAVEEYFTNIITSGASLSDFWPETTLEEWNSTHTS